MKTRKKNTFKYTATKKAAKWIKKSYTHRFNILYGAVRSSKDYNATIAFVETVKRADYDMFMIGAVDVKNALRIQGRYIMDYLGGIAKKTTYLEAPAITFPYNGMTKIIIFAGGKNNGSDAGIQGLTLHSVYFTEINLLNIDFINQAIKRTSSFIDARIFGTFNPKGYRDPFKTDILDVWEKYQKENPTKKWLNIEHMMLFDNPIFTDEMIEMIKSSYDPNSVGYKRDILGEYTDPEGAVYTVRDYNILDTVNPNRYEEYITVADLGETRSGTSFLCIGLTYNQEQQQKEIHVIRSYRHLNISVPEAQRMSQTQYANEYTTFIKDCIKFLHKAPKIVLYDGDIDFYNDLKRYMAINQLGNLTIKFIPDKSEEVERINMGQSLLYLGKIRIYNQCQDVIDDLRNSQYDQKAYEDRAKMQRLSVFDSLTGHADSLDALDYGMLYYRKQLNK